MRIVEEGYLKRTVSKLNKYTEMHATYTGLFNWLDTLEITPLQDLSFQSDLKYFEELNFIFSVISSIIAHPHISNTGEYIILRTELANTVSSETFRMTMRDPTLWKRQNLKMVPEQVYYYQNIDELCIYENIFIVTLIKLIESVLLKYNEFYVSLIETFEGQDKLSLSSNNVGVAFNRIQRLTKKLKYIKNTRFFKEINRRGGVLKTVHPTNILLKDRWYNYCFKFYRSLIAYSDKKSLLKDFRLYHFFLLLRSLKNYGFKPTQQGLAIKRDENGEFLFTNLQFSNEMFDLEIEPYQDIGLKVQISNKFVKAIRTKKATHLLVFEPQSGMENIQKISETAKKSFITIEAMYLWQLVYVDDKVRRSFKNPLSEQALMDKWLETKIYHSEASLKIYRTYCPSCKNQTLDVDMKAHLYCTTCGSIFAFYHDDESKNNVWFLKLRRQK